MGNTISELARTIHPCCNYFSLTIMPCTTCKITQAGIDAFESYVKALREYIS